MGIPSSNGCAIRAPETIRDHRWQLGTAHAARASLGSFVFFSPGLFMPCRHNHRGVALPAALVIAAATAMLATAALCTARSATQLAGTVVAAEDAFRLAELGVAAGLRLAKASPALLPTTGETPVTELAVAGTGRVSASIAALGSDTLCPALAPLPAIRRHYEIHATGRADRGAAATHVQGFFVCAESCTTAWCEAAEELPTASYWRALTGDAPAASGSAQ